MCWQQREGVDQALKIFAGVSTTEAEYKGPIDPEPIENGLVLGWIGRLFLGRFARGADRLDLGRGKAKQPDRVEAGGLGDGQEKVILGESSQMTVKPAADLFVSKIGFLKKKWNEVVDNCCEFRASDGSMGKAVELPSLERTEQEKPIELTGIFPKDTLDGVLKGMLTLVVTTADFAKLGSAAGR